MRQWRAAVMLLVFVTTYTRAQQRKPVCKVAVDIGHTEESRGATSARGVGEYVFNRNFAQVLVEKLARQGGLEAFVLDQTNKNLQERVTAANLRDADLLVSIHHDSVQPQYLSTWVHSGAEHKYSDRFSGYSLFVSGKNPQFDKSLRLARDIGSNLSEAGFNRSLHHAEKIPGENRTLIDPKLGIYQYDDLIVLKLPPIPAALLECGVIVNRHDETELSDPAYVRKMVAAVAKGIVQACQSFGSLEAGK